MELRTRSKSSLARGCLNIFSIYLVVFATFTAFTTLKAHIDDIEIMDESFVRKPLVELNEDNWQLMLNGEWMVEFFAPWCPACKNLAPTWERFAKNARDLNVNVAKIDVTTSPSLSGRFFVTALPTIYHVKEGQFRQYRGSRDGDALFLFLKLKQWEKIEPISAWKKPDTIHMSILSYFFKLSHTLKDFNVRLQEEYGLPTWGSYALFAIGTIFVGATLGLLLVCVVDFLYPPKKSQRQTFSESIEKAGSDAIEDLATDEIEDENDDERDDDDDADADDDEEEGVDDDEADENAGEGADVGDDDDDDSEGEKNSNASESDEPESEKDAKKSLSAKAGAVGTKEQQTTIDNEKKNDDSNGGTSPAEVRKRKPRKAD